MKKILILSLLLVLVVTFLNAEIKFDLGGKIYNQYRWTNSSGDIYWKNSNFGSYSAGATMWPGYGRKDKKFANFMRTEAEFEVNASVSKYVKAYLRTKTIFNSNEETGDGEHSASSWSDDWDNSRGFFKLRGFLITVNPNWFLVKNIELGTPMGLPFNKWFVADRRYIDRDNIKGILVRGGELGDTFTYNFARMWNASYMGPGWNGLNSFRSEDATYVSNFVFDPMNNQFVTDLNVMLYSDANLDPEDEDMAEDTVDDGSLDREDDYNQLGISLDMKYALSEMMSVEVMGMYNFQRYPDRLDEDEDNIADPLSWVTHKTPAHWWGTNEPYAEANTVNGILTFRSTDPLDMGFSPKAQFFYIDDDFYSPFGSRREHDMLMINGGIDALRFTASDDRAEGARQHQSLKTFLYGGGQSAVNQAMTDNNFLRLGEDFYESPVGYMGATFDGNYDLGFASVDGQINYILRTDNNEGKIDEKDENYEGDDSDAAWYYEKPRDFSAIVGDVSLKTRQLNMDWVFTGKFGNWQDVRADYMDDGVQAVGTHNVELQAMVFEVAVKKQLLKALNVELKPRLQQIVFTEEGTDIEGSEYDNDYTNTDLVFNHKWVYNFGGFDFWLRGEHFVKTFESDLSDEDLDLGWSTIHAAFEVKF